MSSDPPNKGSSPPIPVGTDATNVAQPHLLSVSPGLPSRPQLNAPTQSRPAGYAPRPKPARPLAHSPATFVGLQPSLQAGAAAPPALPFAPQQAASGACLPSSVSGSPPGTPQATQLPRTRSFQAGYAYSAITPDQFTTPLPATPRRSPAPTETERNALLATQAHKTVGPTSVELLARAGDDYAKAEYIMSHFHGSPSFTFASFLRTVFSPDFVKDKGASGASNSSRRILSSWLCGYSAHGTRPAEILDLWHKHPYSTHFDNRQLCRAQFSGLSVPLLAPLYIDQHPSLSTYLPPAGLPGVPGSPLLYRAREGVEEWATRATLHRIDREAHDLVSQDGGLHQGATVNWDVFKYFSLKEEIARVQRLAPVIWNTLKTICFNRRIHDPSKSDSDLESASETDSNAEDSDLDVAWEPGVRGAGRKRQNPSLAVAASIFMLLRFRNKAVNFFQTMTGVFSFACNAHKTIFRAFNRIGFSTAHSTVHRHLRRLARSERQAVIDLGEQAYRTASDPTYEPRRYFLLVYDNVQKYRVPRSASVAKKTHLVTGTAATAIALEDIPIGAFDPRPYEANIARQERQSLTLDKLLADIQQDHMRQVGCGMILRIVRAHIPALGHLSQPLEARFCTPAPGGYAKHRLPVRKTEIYPLATSGINEATTKGNNEVVHDLVATQMKMKPEWFDVMLNMVCGDQMTTDRLRKAVRYRSKDVNAFEQRRWVLPIAQIWHMKHAFLKVIFNVHWSPLVAEGVFGLRHAVEALGRKINASECDFYTCHDALKVVFDTFILVLFLGRVRERFGAQLTDAARKKFSSKSHMLEELSAYFDEGEPLHAASLEVLDEIAGSVYDSYLTTSAYEAAISSDEDLEPSQSRINSLMTEVLTRLQDPHVSSSSDTKSSSDSSSPSEDEKPQRTKPLKTAMLRSLPSIGDQGLATAILLLRDSFWYFELATAVAEGDIGRVMEVIKILRIAFWGGGATNYGNELLEMACNHFYEYPADLLKAVLNNYLVNPSGLPGHFHELDLLQEHHNLAIKTVFNSKNSDFDSTFMKDSVALNIVGLAGLRDSLLYLLGLNRAARGKTQSEYEADINVLAQHYRGTDSILVRQPTRRHRFLPPDVFGLGIERLGSKSLGDFLRRTALEAPEPGPDGAEGGGLPIVIGAGPADMDRCP